jgi:hypothetical protein
LSIIKNKDLTPDRPIPTPINGFIELGRRTMKVTASNRAERNCRPVPRIVSRRPFLAASLKARPLTSLIKTLSSNLRIHFCNRTSYLAVLGLMLRSFSECLRCCLLEVPSTCFVGNIWMNGNPTDPSISPCSCLCEMPYEPEGADKTNLDHLVPSRKQLYV